MKFLLLDTTINCAEETTTGDLFESREAVADYLAEYYPAENWGHFAIISVDLDKHITSEVLSEAREALLEKARNEQEAEEAHRVGLHNYFMTPGR